jgi:hypothetical protein
MSSFLAFAGDKIVGLVTSLANKVLGDKIKTVLVQRKMKRLVEDAVDRIIAQSDEYLTTEGAGDQQKEVIITCLCEKLQPLVDDPQTIFCGNLDGKKLFDLCHPKGELPEAIRHEGLEQFYTLLFPQIAHFVAGSRTALAEWQAEGYREGFRRLSQIADEITSMSVKVSSLPGAVVDELQSQAEQKGDMLLREFAQTLLNGILLRLDLSPLRAERSLHGSLKEHFVIPQLRERRENAENVGHEEWILYHLCRPGARRIVHGSAGVGKSTCALWLQSRLLETSPGRLAVLLRLRGETDLEEHSLLNLLKKQAGVHLAESITDDLLRNWHEAGKLVILLDGFDEVTETRRDAVEKWIQALGVSAKQSSIVVTSRPLQSGHLEGLRKPWQQWDLLPFDEARIIDFIQRWHHHLPEGELSATERQVNASGLARTFLNDPSLKPLADTPLMLGTLLFVHHRDKKLPSGRVDLYERYITAMLGLRDSGLGIEARATNLTDKQKRRILAHIALHFHCHSLNEVNDDTMRTLVATALDKLKFDETADCLLPALAERSGLLQGPGAWSFSHKTIGEFLVAELVCEGSTFLREGARLDRQELWKHRHEDPWTAVLFFWAGKTTPLELEEFCFELVKEKREEGPLLALALLGDQGERLDFERQRELALRLLKRKWTLRDSASESVASFECAPESQYVELTVQNISLRGIRNQSHINLLQGLFHSGVVSLDMCGSAAPSNKNDLAIAMFWALSKSDTKIELGEARALTHLPSDVFAGLCLSCVIERQFSLGDSSDVIQTWLENFPEKSDTLLLTLIGAWKNIKEDGSPQKDETLTIHLLARLIWRNRELEVNEDWLRDSFEWCNWHNSMCGDVLQQFCDAFISGRVESRAMSKEEHEELTRWLKALLKRREQLTAKSDSSEGSDAR